MMFQITAVLYPTRCRTFLTAATQPMRAEASSPFAVLHQPAPIVIDVVVLIVAARCLPLQFKLTAPTQSVVVSETEEVESARSPFARTLAIACCETTEPDQLRFSLS